MRKGTHQTEEHIKNRVNARKRNGTYVHSEETRRKSSESHKGNHPSEETRRRLSEARKGKKQSKEHITNRVNARKRNGNYIPSEETLDRLKRMSDARKGKPGKKNSEETRRKISIANIGRKPSEETRKTMSIAHAGKKDSEETKLKKSNAGKRKIFTDIHRGNISKARSTPEEIKRQREIRLHQTFPFKDTSIEVKLQDELSLREYAYYKHYPIIGQPDIAFPDLKIAIFADGDYAHLNPEKYKATDTAFGTTGEQKWARDKFVNEELQKKGWLVLRYWEHEIKSNIMQITDLIEDKIVDRIYEKEISQEVII